MGFREDAEKAWAERKKEAQEQEQKRIAEEQKRNAEILIDSFEEDFGIRPDRVDPEAMTAAMDEDGITLVWDCGWHLLKQCKKCGGRILSHHIFNMADLGRCLEKGQWQYHYCETPTPSTEANPIGTSRVMTEEEANLLNALTAFIQSGLEL